MRSDAAAPLRAPAAGARAAAPARTARRAPAAQLQRRRLTRVREDLGGPRSRSSSARRAKADGAAAAADRGLRPSELRAHATRRPLSADKPPTAVRRSKLAAGLPLRKPTNNALRIARARGGPTLDRASLRRPPRPAMTGPRGGPRTPPRRSQGNARRPIRRAESVRASAVDVVASPAATPRSAPIRAEPSSTRSPSQRLPARPGVDVDDA